MSLLPEKTLWPKKSISSYTAAYVGFIPSGDCYRVDLKIYRRLPILDFHFLLLYGSEGELMNLIANLFVGFRDFFELPKMTVPLLCDHGELGLVFCVVEVHISSLVGGEVVGPVRRRGLVVTS